MEDAQIVDLYWRRSDDAISETNLKYGSYCRSIAYGILRNREDTEECVEDAYMGAWNAMPDKRPQHLPPLLAKITRNAALNRIAEQNRQCRGGGEIPLCLDELSECIPSGFSVEQEIEEQELGQLLQKFITELPKSERRVFLGRYFYMIPVKEIAQRLGFTQSKVKSMLYRTRKILMDYLKEEGICQIK